MRNHDIEAAFLAQVARDADAEQATRFIGEVRDRLRKGAEEYGDHGFRDRSFTEVLAEAREEGEDVPGWLVLGFQLLADEELPDSHREHLERMLVAASAKSFEMWQILDLATEFYDEAAGQISD